MKNKPTDGVSGDRWLTEQQVSEQVHISCSTLQKHRFLNKGIPYSKFGSAVRYSQKDVDAFMTAHRVSTANAARQQPDVR